MPWPKQTHCKHGHEYTPENTYWHPHSDGNQTPVRRCRTCNRERVARQRRKQGIPVRTKPTHCQKGHEYTPQNIYWWYQPKSGTMVRRCRICRRLRERANYLENRHRWYPRCVSCLRKTHYQEMTNGFCACCVEKQDEAALFDRYEPISEMVA